MSDKPTETNEVEREGTELDKSDVSSTPEAQIEETHAVASELGYTKFVHAAFFGLAVLAAFLMGRVVLTVWNALADWPWATEIAPALLTYGEDGRGTWSTIVGGAVGALAVLLIYRREGVRAWAAEVASELGRVAWPTREAVQNGVVVVLVASAIFTVYIAVLDRFWGFVTTLVYGA